MKKLLSLLILFAAYLGQSQTNAGVKQRRNAFYFELLGNAQFYSFNYERLFSLNEKTLLAARVGCGVMLMGDMPDEGEELAYALFPLEFNFLFGKGSHNLELGVGHTYNTQVYAQYFNTPGPVAPIFYHRHYITSRVGYRFQRPGHRFLLRAGLLPEMIYRPGYVEVPSSDFKKKQLVLWGGLSLGWMF